jgi:hypothetical protein
MDSTDKLTFKAFLSHRYKSPEVNLYFFRLFERSAHMHFEVDVGTSSTNVTRLERMIRDSDAFVGLYPFPKPGTQSANRSELINASKYFLLELDIALRTRKPILVFADQRYGDLFRLPEVARIVLYDSQEIVAGGGGPQEGRFSRVIGDFVNFLKAVVRAKEAEPIVTPATSIGLVVPTTGRSASAYTFDEIRLLEDLIERSGGSAPILPPESGVLNGGLYRWLSQLDMAVADVGDISMRTGIVPFFHGIGLPTVRLWKGSRGYNSVKNRLGYRTLFGGVEVGYPKDIVHWQTAEELESGLRTRLTRIEEPVRRIGTLEEAEKYFGAATLRNEMVFVSYSGKDYQIGQTIVRELKKRFQEVFDYRDGESITAGQPWLQEIFDKLAKAALGIPLISPHYLASGNCLHEARQMVAQQDAGKLSIIPMKLVDDEVTLPAWAEDRQYLRLWEHKNPKAAVAKLIASFDRGASGLRPTH